MQATLGDHAVAARCPICGGTDFIPGPKGRLSPNGLLPRCARCKTLERHRAFRRVLETLCEATDGASRSALQFSPDRSVDAGWFASYELSEFGGANSLDLQAIDRPDRSYDVVICNHVLEHVENDRAALGELVRVLSPAGWLFLSVPDPVRVERTVQYGRARSDKHGHWRIYGPDIVALLVAAVRPAGALAVMARDPVTGEPDRCFVVSPSEGVLARALQALAAAGLEAARVV